MDDVHSVFKTVFKNSGFLVVCSLVVLTPMFRGAVHLWAETVIQMLVLTGGLFVFLGKLLSRDPSEAVPTAEIQGPGVTKRRSKGRIDSEKVSRSMGSSGSRITKSSGRGAGLGLSAKQIGWLVVVPCTLLGAWATFFSRQGSLAMEGMIMLVTYLALFYIACDVVRTRKEQRILVGVIVGMALFLSIIGMLKRFDLLVFPWWDYSEELGKGGRGLSLSGVYVNRNHMAGFLEMSIPVLLGLFLTRSRSIEVRTGMICLVLFLIVAQALTLSRGGWTATVGALVFMMVVLLLKKGFQQKRLIAGIAVSVVVVGAIILASTPVVQRITTLTKVELDDNLIGRITFWDGTETLIKDNLYTGTGPGTYAEAFPAYQAPGMAVLPLYAHQDYLQFMADTGIFFIPLVLWLLFLFFREGFRKLNGRSRQTMGITLGCMASMVAILIHSFSDFNLHIPANIVLFTVLTAMVFKRV
ncbi:O-Antigen ligase [Desulfocicer vacuolatum DSM 3385]|uniref:O-Antigen ligase n=1 Tax=Desulfocicer vacuolatum DSM 3385 TaxID=1121400 RepID=A0A1W1Z149_9BACT|nr:O-antigen ligase family protein [Desulfocicer vacuolatum]SMC42149.1 O-Antigen ligase [Desulfocicer vacuolatum DSM 3385]